jgi:hypothetical protein
MQGIEDCGALVAPRHVSTVDNRAQHTPKKIRSATLGGESAGFSLLLALVGRLSALLALPWTACTTLDSLQLLLLSLSVDSLSCGLL